MCYEITYCNIQNDECYVHNVCMHGSTNLCLSHHKLNVNILNHASTYIVEITKPNCMYFTESLGYAPQEILKNCTI